MAEILMIGFHSFIYAAKSVASLYSSAPLITTLTTPAIKSCEYAGGSRYCHLKVHRRYVSIRLGLMLYFERCFSVRTAWRLAWLRCGFLRDRGVYMFGLRFTCAKNAFRKVSPSLSEGVQGQVQRSRVGDSHFKHIYNFGFVGKIRYFRSYD